MNDSTNPDKPSSVVEAIGAASSEDKSDSEKKKIVHADDLPEPESIESKPIRVDSKADQTRPGLLAKLDVRTIIQSSIGVMAGLHGVLAILFFIFPGWFIEGRSFDAVLIQILGLALATFAVMLGLLALKPKQRRHLVWYPFAIMVGMSAILIGHWTSGSGIPFLWKLITVANTILTIAMTVIIVRLWLPGKVEKNSD